jgi:hypothetical protein
MVTGHGIGQHVAALGVIAAWSILGVALAIRGFSWEGKRG